MQQVPVHAVLGLKLLSIPPDFPLDVEYVYLIEVDNGFRVVLGTPEGKRMLRDEFQALVNDPEGRAIMRDAKGSEP
jgi:hypothetical protein